MSKEYTFPPKLKLIVDHLDAVRTLNEYVNGAGLKKDMQGLSNHLQRELSRSVLHPAGWDDLEAVDGYLYSSPKSVSPENQLIQKWCVGEEDFIAIEIDPAGPVRADDEPYVNLYVPSTWKKRQAFIKKLEPPPGFEHVSHYSDDEVSEDTSIFKELPYTRYVVDGMFDLNRFIQAFREATKALVDMEKGIDQILAGLV